MTCFVVAGVNGRFFLGCVVHPQEVPRVVDSPAFARKFVTAAEADLFGGRWFREGTYGVVCPLPWALREGEALARLGLAAVTRAAGHVVA